MANPGEDRLADARDGMSGPVLVAGASGFVGRRLCPALVNAGFEVRAMTRRPTEYRGAGEAVGADASDMPSLRAALQHCATAYYLVHSLSRADFETKDAAAAGAFGKAAADQGVGRIIYLGGLGADHGHLSAHLRSRRQVETLLARAGVPVTTLRAGIIVGHGGISWEITRQLVEHLPAMVVPRWVWTRTQPIAAGGRHPISGRRPASARDSRAGLRYRRAGCSGLCRHAAPGCRRRGAKDANRARASAVAVAVLPLAVVSHRRRRTDRTVADRFDDERGGRA